MKEKTKRKKKKVMRFRLSTIFLYFLFLVFFSLTSYIYFGGAKINPFVSANTVLPYESFKISLGDSFPKNIEDEIRNKLSQIEKDGTKRFVFDTNSEIKLGWGENGYLLTKYIIPVSHFYTISDDFKPNSQKIVIDSSIPSDIQSLLKIKYPTASVVNNVKQSLDSNGKTVGLIQAKDLTFDYKLLKYEGKYFLDNKEGAIKYSVKLNQDNPFLENILKRNLDSLKEFEYSLEKVATLNQTGVTAISRALASKIEATNDNGWPAKKISAFLKSSDLTHISNEVSNVDGCIPSDGMRFCTNPKYMKTLKDIGVDIIELTGNHNNDFGSKWNLDTIKYYDAQGWKYFGGGKDINDASKILYVDVKGTKLAFIGYNFYDTMLGTGAIATKKTAGANSYSDSKMKKNVEEAKKNADIVIVDFQFQECYSYPAHRGVYPICYKPLTSPDQQKYFRKAVEYGADIVVGTQAHQPQTYEIYNGKLIFYGLGNLFFDQAYWLGTRQGIILTHYFNEGKLIQTKLTTTMNDINLQPYITTGEERKYLLELLRDARN